MKSKIKHTHSKTYAKKVAKKQQSLRKILIEQILLETVLKYQCGLPITPEQKLALLSDTAELRKFSNEQLVKEYGRIMYASGAEEGEQIYDAGY